MKGSIKAAVLSASLLMGMSVQAAHADVISSDAALCHYFPEFGTTLVHVEHTRPRWARHIRGTDKELHAQATRLNAFLIKHPHAHYVHGLLWEGVYPSCWPDAAAMQQA